MKNKKLISSLIVIAFVSMFFSSISNSRSLNLNDLPKISQGNGDDLINVNFIIYIDGNWSETVEMYDWCTGAGTEEVPWVIEGIHVTNNEQSAHISIKTAEHFIIRNVTVSNYAAPYGHYAFAGIYVEKGEYGLIENCTIVNCSTGISLYEAKDSIKITNNTFIGSHNNNNETGWGAAIRIYEAKGVEIYYNDIYNYYDGIVVRNAEEIYIDNNKIETSFGHISDTGIYFYTVCNSSIIDNDFYGCTFAGHAYDNIVTSGIDGLKLSSDNFGEDCLNLEIYGNKFYDLNGNLIENNLINDNVVIVCVVIVCVVIVCVVCIGVLIKRKRK